MKPNAKTMACNNTKTPTKSRRHPSLIIQTSKFSFHVISLHGSAVTSPDMSIRDKGDHLDRSFPDKLLALEELRPNFSFSVNRSMLFTGASFQMTVSQSVQQLRSTNWPMRNAC